MKQSGFSIFFLGVAVTVWAGSGIRMEPTRYLRGDDPGWSEPDLDDGHWSSLHPGKKRGEPRRWWARTAFELGPSFDPNDDLAILIRTLASYQIYWDGNPLGQNGLPGTDRKSEIAGSHFHMVVIPRSLVSPGRHVLALRMSSWHSVLPSDLFEIKTGPLAGMSVTNRLATGFYTAVFALVLAAGLSFLAYGDQRDPATKRFGWLCLAVAVLLALEHGKYLVHYPYPLQFYRLIIITLFTQTVSILLPWFLMARFQLAYRGFLVAAVVPPLLAPLFWYDPDLHCYWIFLYGLAYSLFLCLHAQRLGKKGWPPIGIAVGISFLLIIFTGDRFADRWFFPSFLLMVALLAARLIWETRAWREALIAEQLTSSRLQLELLRRSIQPHFLKNTLAAAMAWFEENPRKGARLLSSLAEELDCFFRIGDRERIKFETELTLCRHHVETMSLLLDCPLALDVSGPDEDLALPPGILITCVENALTHGQFSTGKQTIAIEVTKTGDHLEIRVANPAKPCGDVKEGTGSRYLRALLTRYYPHAWSLAQGYEAGQWVVTIAIHGFSDEAGR